MKLEKEDTKCWLTSVLQTPEALLTCDLVFPLYFLGTKSQTSAIFWRTFVSIVSSVPQERLVRTAEIFGSQPRFRNSSCLCGTDLRFVSAFLQLGTGGSSLRFSAMNRFWGCVFLIINGMANNLCFSFMVNLILLVNPCKKGFSFWFFCSSHSPKGQNFGQDKQQPYYHFHWNPLVKGSWTRKKK